MARPNRLRDLMHRRGVNALLHFTPAENLASILEHGLHPRQALDDADHPYVYTDERRGDGFLDAISLSVCYYNYPMLRRLRRDAPRQKWAILGLHPELLIGADLRFCASNAASGHYRRTMRQFRGLRDFEDMFRDRCPFGFHRGEGYRDTFGYPDNMPTDPQAEILHFGAIHPEWIFSIVTDDAEVAENANELIGANGLEGVQVHVTDLAPRFVVNHLQWG
ncbi:DarT ssDNA thymidine ADP-ribosyltransferase family protein [Paracoccus sp. ME4]|uniref:DarT ssDNA thymidine ADP-ribosyltransferase family protein n=1 Tax=Paracoccus sp. ME4 TaxID=3138066 RepID=UPI00398A9ADE